MPKIQAFYFFNDGTFYDAYVRKIRNGYSLKIGRPKKEPIEALPFEVIPIHNERGFLMPSEDITEGNGTYSPTTFRTSLYYTFWGKVSHAPIPVGFYIVAKGELHEPGKFYRYVGFGPTSEALKPIRFNAFVTEVEARLLCNKSALGRLAPFKDADKIDEAVAEFRRKLDGLELKLFYNEDEGTLQVLRDSVYTTTKNDYDETDPLYKGAVKVPQQLFYSLDMNITYTRNDDEQFAVQAFPEGNPKDGRTTE